MPRLAEALETPPTPRAQRAEGRFPRGSRRVVAVPLPQPAQGVDPAASRTRHAGCGGIAAALLLGGATALAVAVSGVAAAPLGGSFPDQPSAAVGIDAWLRAREWVDALAAPAGDDPVGGVDLGSVAAVSVTLRAGGRTIGIGEDATADAGSLRRAVARALSRASDHAAFSWPEGLRTEFARDLTLELDLAGTPQRLLGATFEEAGRRVRPGLDGLAARRGERWAHAFPSRLLASGMAGDPSRPLRQLARDLDLPPLELSELAALDAFALYRVPTLTLVQTRPGGVPVQTLRGAATVPLWSIDEARVVEMAGSLLAHLETSLAPTEVDGVARDAIASLRGLGLRGDYDPIADRHRPLAASPFEQALVAAAAARLAAVSAPHADRAGSLALRVLRDLAIENPIEEHPLGGLDSAAAIVLAATWIGGELDPRTRELVDRARIMTLDAVRRGDGREGDAAAAPTPGRAIIAAVAALELLQAAEGERAALDRQSALRLGTRVWAEIAPAQRIGLLPWFALLSSRAATDSGPPIAELAVLRQALWARQIGEGPGDGGGDPTIAPGDLAGGFDLDDDALPAADGRSLVPAVGLAILMDDRRLSDPRGMDAADLRTAVASHRRAVRFLAQLQSGEEERWRWRNAEAALGGIRSALWEVRQPVLLQAMGLWLLAESIAIGVP